MPITPADFDGSGGTYMGGSATAPTPQLSMDAGTVSERNQSQVAFWRHPPDYELLTEQELDDFAQQYAALGQPVNRQLTSIDTALPDTWGTTRYTLTFTEDSWPTP